jgi:hypothetical protein
VSSVAGRSVPKILYGFGREDQLDRDKCAAGRSSVLRPVRPNPDLLAVMAQVPERLAACMRATGALVMLSTAGKLAQQHREHVQGATPTYRLCPTT